MRFGREVIEVATFRAAAEANNELTDVEHDDDGRILRDNVYGSIDTDVWRRDFTCNALYYNIADFSIWDYTGGVDDIRKRRIELIGDALKRLREDPVRMLRAVRFAAKLGFTIADDVSAAMHETVELLTNGSRRAFVRRVPEVVSGWLLTAHVRTPLGVSALRSTVPGNEPRARSR